MLPLLFCCSYLSGVVEGGGGGPIVPGGNHDLLEGLGLEVGALDLAVEVVHVGAVVLTPVEVEGVLGHVGLESVDGVRGGLELHGGADHDVGLHPEKNVGVSEGDAGLCKGGRREKVPGGADSAGSGQVSSRRATYNILYNKKSASVRRWTRVGHVRGDVEAKFRGTTTLSVTTGRKTAEYGTIMVLFEISCRFTGTYTIYVSTYWAKMSKKDGNRDLRDGEP